MDPTQVKAFNNWSRPTSAIEIRSFLGLAGYYRRFVKGFSKIVMPLTQLTKKTTNLNVLMSVRRVFRN